MDDLIYRQAVRRAHEQYAETTHSPENSCKDDEFWCPEDRVCKKEKDRINEGSPKEISGDRWSEEGDPFDGHADVAGYILIDLYTGAVQSIATSEVEDAVKGLERIGPDTGDSDWDVWKGEEYMVAAIPRKGGGDKTSWQDRAAQAGKDFADSGGKMFTDEG